MNSMNTIINASNSEHSPIEDPFAEMLELGRKISTDKKCETLQYQVGKLQELLINYRKSYAVLLKEFEKLKGSYPKTDVNSLLIQLSLLCNGSISITINEHKDKYDVHTLSYESPYDFYMEPYGEESHSYNCTPIDIDIIDEMGFNDTTLKLDCYYNGKFFRVIHYNLYDLLQSAIALINDKQNINQ